MSISRRQLYALGEPLGECVTEVGPDRRYKRMGGGGGGGKSTGVTYTSNIPEYAEGSFMNLVGRSEALSNQPYQPYTAQRIQGFTPMQQQSFQNAQVQTPAQQITAGSGLAAAAGMGGLQAGQYQPQQVGTQSFIQGQNARNFMSPYMQQVVDIQKREAARDAQIAGTQRNAQAVKAGAFGGSRQAIMDAEANRNLMTQLGDIQGRGLQSAFDQAQRQFNQEQGLGLQAQQANQQAGLEGQRLGLSGLGVALQGAGTLGQLGQQQFGQQMDITQMLNTLGQQQQQQGQRQLDQQFADFQAQRDYPYQQLGFLSDILRGVSGSTRTMYSSQPQASGLQTLAGLGTAAAGFGKLFKEGGEVSGYAAGGIVDAAQLTGQLEQMSDQGLQQYTQIHKEDPYTASLAIAEARRRQQLRQAAANAQDVEPKQGTVIERELEGIAAAAPQIEYADGGIVSYADGGDVDWRERTGMFVEGETVNPLWWLNLGDVARGGKSIEEYYGEDEDTRPAIAAPGPGGRARPNVPSGLAAAAPAQMPAPAEETPPSRTPPVSGGVGSRSSRSAGAGLGALVPDMGADEVMTEGERRIGEMSAEERRVLEGEKADMEQRFKEQGVFGEQREKRLKEREAGLEDKTRDAKNMALIQAGLAILSADPSRGALAAIGEGALKGVGAYKGDMEKIEAQREGIGEKMDELLELRRQESNARGEKLAEIRSRIRGVERDAKKSTFELWKGVGVPLKAKEREMAFQAALKQREIESNERNARISAGGRNNTLEIAREYAASKKIPLHQAIQEISAKGGGFDPREAYAEYLKTPAAMLNPISFDAFSRQFAPTMGAGTPNIDLSKWGKPTLVPQ